MPRAAETMLLAFPGSRLRAMDGHVELAVAEAVASGAARPARVTEVILAMYQQIDGKPASRKSVRRVSAAGREWLLQRVARRLFAGGHWFETACQSCGASFDLQLSLSDIPRAAPGPGYPVAEVKTSMGPRMFEVPNGAHEEALAESRSKDPRRVFAALCGLSEDAQTEAIRFDERDLMRIDAGIEAVSPQIADGVDVVCPDCEANVHARIDPLGFAFPDVKQVLNEVHLIATAYHWSEAEILDLSLSRRRAYVDLIGSGARGGTMQGRRLS